MKKILLLLSVIMLTSCSNKPDFSKIKKGMSVKEVTDIVGSPSKQQDNPMLGKWYVYGDNIIIFQNDTVTKSTTKKEFEKSLDSFMTDLDSLDTTIKKNL